MSNPDIENESRQLRHAAMFNDCVFAIALAWAGHEMWQRGMLPFEKPTCDIPTMLGGDFDDDGQMDEVGGGVCRFSSFIRFGSYVMLPYILLCMAFIVSPLKGTLLMRWRGLSLERGEDGARPNLFNAARFVLFNTALVPIYFVILYGAYHDYEMTLHQQSGVVILMAAMGAVLTLASRLVGGADTLDERISGLKVVLSPKALKKLEKRAAGKWRVFAGLRKLNYFLAPVMVFIFFGWQGFNVLREKDTPKEYLAFLYDRPQVPWDDNGYFALAGLNAPAGEADFYAFGRRHVIADATQFAEMERYAHIPYIQNVPAVSGTLPDDGEDAPEKLRIGEAADQNWHCIYGLPNEYNPHDEQQCPPDMDLQAALDENRVLLSRLADLPHYPVFARPDHFIASNYYGQDLLDLARIYAAETVVMADRGEVDRAVAQWAAFTGAYTKMVLSRTMLVDKAIYMILYSIQMDTLETLLDKHPEIARDHADKILSVMALNDITQFHAAQMVPDDWRILEPWTVGAIGDAGYVRGQAYICLQRYAAQASLPAYELQGPASEALCEDIFPADVSQMMIKSFLSPGNPVSNVIYSMLFGGVLKGQTLMVNMHREIARTRMARLAVMMLRDGVTPDGVDDYLAGPGAEFDDPFQPAGSPFKWDADQGALYSDYHSEFDSERTLRFRVNLTGAE